VRARDVIRVEGDDHVVAPEAFLGEPGVVVAVLGARLEAALGRLVLRPPAAREVPRAEARTELPHRLVVAFVEYPRVVRVVHRDECRHRLFQHVERLETRHEGRRDADA
jgi:hypothetical protein